MVVADFGLARLVMKEKSQGRTSSPEKPVKGTLAELRRPDRRKRYTVVGNPYWMAPEMIRGECVKLKTINIKGQLLIISSLGQSRTVKISCTYPNLCSIPLRKKL